MARLSPGLSTSLGINVTVTAPPSVQVESTAVVLSLGLAATRMPKCADGTVIDASTGSTSPVCGPQAVCTDVRLSVFSSTTVIRCTCPNDGYALASATVPAHLAPYSLGCVVATQASQLRMRQDL